MKTLIVTNGQSGVDAITHAGIEGDVFSWDDVLHDGPVPGGYTLEILSELRARFISSLGWGDFQAVHASLLARNEKLKFAAAFDELVLFFEHDLYDQLQLIQVVALLNKEIDRPERVSVVHPPGFIGYCTPDELQASFENRRQLRTEAFSIVSEIWEAFTAESPEKLEALLNGGISDDSTEAFPHIASGLLRLAQEYPDHMTELSRTEMQILSFLSQGGTHKFGKLFRAVMDAEEAAFLGDLSFEAYLVDLTVGNHPLVKHTPSREAQSSGKAKDEAPVSFLSDLGGTYEITPAGQQVLAGKIGKSAFLAIDRWIGGVHVNASNFWRWVPERNAFMN